MAYTYDPTTDRGKVRLLIGDNVEGAGVLPDGSNMTDVDIDAFLEMNDDVLQDTVAAVLDHLSIVWAKVADITIGPRKESLSQVSKQYSLRAEKEREVVGGGSVSFGVGWTRDDGYAEAAAAEESEYS